MCQVSTNCELLMYIYLSLAQPDNYFSAGAYRLEIIIIIIINFTTREGIHKRQSLYKVSAQNITLQKQQRNKEIYKTTLKTKYTETNKSRNTKHQLTHT